MLVMLLVAALAPFLVPAMGWVESDKKVTRDSRPPSLVISKNISSSGTGKWNPIKCDRKRFGKLQKSNLTNGHDSSTSEGNPGLTLNDAVNSFSGKIGVGSPPKYYTLLVDSGSAITFVGANASYVTTNTSVKTSAKLDVIYGTGYMHGDVYLDTVTIGPGLVITNQTIGVAFNTSGILPYDGILGIGPTGLTLKTLTPYNESLVPTVTDNLYEQNKIFQNLVAVSFVPLALSSGSLRTGELTFGDTDSSKYVGDIEYVPISNVAPTSSYWGVEASIQYGSANDSNSVSILNTGSGIIDTGTTLTYLSSDAYERYVAATGAVLNKTMDYLYITPAQYDKLQSLYFGVGNRTFELTPNAQIWPRQFNSLINGDPDLIYLIIHEKPESLLAGTDFIAGLTFLERIYAVFDTSNHRVGFANTPYTNAETN